jgi:hypothetical protein
MTTVVRDVEEGVVARIQRRRLAFTFPRPPGMTSAGVALNERIDQTF